MVNLSPWRFFDLAVINVFVKFAFAFTNSNSSQRVTHAVQRGNQHFNGAVDCQNERVGNQCLIPCKSNTGQDGIWDDSACTGGIRILQGIFYGCLCNIMCPGDELRGFSSITRGPFSTGYSGQDSPHSSDPGTFLYPPHRRPWPPARSCRRWVSLRYSTPVRRYRY